MYLNICNLQMVYIACLKLCVCLSLSSLGHVGEGNHSNHKIPDRNLLSLISSHCTSMFFFVKIDNMHEARIQRGFLQSAQEALTAYQPTSSLIDIASK